MQLWIFDVDGTLTRTNRLDAACYERAVADHLELEDLDGGWDEFEHPTAAGITRELLDDYGTDDAVDARYRDVRESFLEELKAAVRGGTEIEPVLGASKVLDKLRTADETSVAIATGDWSHSSSFKVDRAGLEVGNLPRATSDDHVARADIIRRVIERSGGRSTYDRIVYVGDGSWDWRDARAVGIDFVGVGAGEHGDRLRAAGASNVIPHLTELFDGGANEPR